MRVDTIVGSRIAGRIASDILRVRGFRAGQSYALTERDLLDWTIVRPDGTEEGNVVGIFLDTYRAPDCSDAE